MRAWLQIAFLVACSSRSHSQDPSPRSATTTTMTTTTDASASIDPTLPAGCPATFASAAVGAACAHSGVCAYDEGSCICNSPPWCGGDAPPDPLPPEWQCTPKVRADGCPGSQPSEGAACSPNGLTCDYTCSCLLAATCTNGKWVVSNGPCKP